MATVNLFIILLCLSFGVLAGQTSKVPDPDYLCDLSVVGEFPQGFQFDKDVLDPFKEVFSQCLTSYCNEPQCPDSVGQRHVFRPDNIQTTQVEYRDNTAADFSFYITVDGAEDVNIFPRLLMEDVLASCSNEITNMSSGKGFEIQIVEYPENGSSDDETSSIPTTTETSPVTMTETSPVTMTETSPVTMTETSPVTTGETSSVTTGETSPVTTGETSPVTTGETSPVTLTETSPVTMTETSPVTTGAASPVTMTETSPVTMTETSPITMTETSSVTMTETSPITMTETSPVTMTETSPVTMTETSDNTTTEPPPEDTTPSEEEPGATLESWEIGLITVGCIAGVALAGGLTYYITKKKNSPFDRLRGYSDLGDDDEGQFIGGDGASSLKFHNPAFVEESHFDMNTDNSLYQNNTLVDID